MPSPVLPLVFDANAVLRQLQGDTPADALTPSAASLHALAHLSAFNGTNWDRFRNNLDGTALANAVRSASTNSPNITNYNARGVIVCFDINAVPGTDTVQLIIQAIYASGTTQNLITDGAQSATSNRYFVIYPGMIDTGSVIHVKSGLPLPRTWRVRIVHSAASNFSYALIL